MGQRYLFVSSDRPLREVSNPHRRMMSVARAASLGYPLPEGCTPDMPTAADHMVWCCPPEHARDLALESDPLSFYPRRFTQRRHVCIMQWQLGQEGALLEYIQSHLTGLARDIEVWNTWLGGEPEGGAKPDLIVERALSELTPADLAATLEPDPYGQARCLRVLNR